MLRNIPRNRFSVLCPAVGSLLLLAISTNPVSADSSAGIYAHMLSKLKSLRTYQVTVQETTVLTPLAAGARPRSIASTDDVVFKSPNLFSLVNDGLMGGITVVSNGQTEYFYSSLSQQYASQPAPADVVGGILGAMHSGTVTWLKSKQLTLSGTPVVELAGTTATPRGLVNVVLDVRKSDFLPYQIVMSLPTIIGGTGDGLKITRTQLFTSQKVNLPVSSSDFSFVPPAGSTKVGSFKDLGGGLGAGL